MLIINIIFQLILLIKIQKVISINNNAMNHIYKNLFLDDHRASENENLLKMYDIYTVINCAAELQNDYKNIISYDINLYDIPKEQIILIFKGHMTLVKSI